LVTEIAEDENLWKEHDDEDQESRQRRLLNVEGLLQKLDSSAQIKGISHFTRPVIQKK
jgi:hypothetical protein